MARYKQKKIS